MKMTIASLERKLAPGVEFLVRYTGDHCKQGDRPSRRRVVRNTGELVSLHLDGVNEGKEITLGWKGVTAEAKGGKILLSCEAFEQPFMEITLILQAAKV